MDAAAPAYSYTQKSPLYVLVYGTAIALLVSAWFIHDELPIFLTLVGTGVVTMLVAPCFHHLTVADQGDVLAIRFGPIPLFRRTVQYTDIIKAEVGRTLFLEGWGIHYSIRGGWVWNLWGRKCVVVHFLSGGVLQIGTDDAENLARFLEGKISERGK